MWQDSQRSTMLASATLICRSSGPTPRSSLQTANLCRREIHHVVGYIGVERAFGSLTGLITSPSSALSAWCVASFRSL
jgi:hypothetical protein